MKILWICNIMLPMVARHLGLEASNKEGWISGLCNVILLRQKDNRIDLHVAFPVGRELDGYSELITTPSGSFHCYGFYEDIAHAETYDPSLEIKLKRIIDTVKPDVVHCFGTEFPHTLAACRVVEDKSKILVGIQGLCYACANAYFANLPEKEIETVTFRDVVKRDSLVSQQQKFEQRGKNEIEALKLAANITGRTDLDRYYTGKWNPEARYFSMNETLRPNFYTGIWKEERCLPHSIFISQGDYPLKGLHYMLLALPDILKKYPDVTLWVAGNSLVSYDTWKDRIKISAYGKYLRRLIKEANLQEKVHFLGRLNAQEMKEQYMRSNVFVCCSSIENSPNSLGEAMLLGMPCVSADVGGVPSIFRGGEDGISYKGFRTSKNEFNNDCDSKMTDEMEMEKISKSLANAVIEIWDNPEKRKQFCTNARNHALKTHDREQNYRKMVEIYAEINR